MENDNNAIHKQTFRLHSYEVDQRGVARPDILLSFMLDSAWGHTRDTEFSYSELNDEGQLWVLSRFLAVFHDLPKWDDEITVETWGKGTDKIFGLRDFMVCSQSEKKFLSATSAWLIIDRKTSRIQRIDALDRKFPTQLYRDEIETKLEKIETRDADKTDFKHVVRSSDLDVNRHVNSSKYLLWMLDSFPAEYSEKKNLKSFEINFLSEAKLYDEIYVSSMRDESVLSGGENFYCEVRRESGDAELCRARIVWND
ncbi:MAG TPA: acyl-ACP thioesterase domain-containing protein [Candidatus Acidoferrales bacterium]|nr:acyl-ACP thioesterase domain-containing protein [Candidatus Acidoferrales bacterium]